MILPPDLLQRRKSGANLFISPPALRSMPVLRLTAATSSTLVARYARTAPCC
jgi:hypothetical protein